MTFVTLCPREEFEEMFDTTAYERVRSKYHAEGENDMIYIFIDDK